MWFVSGPLKRKPRHYAHSGRRGFEMRRIMELRARHGHRAYFSTNSTTFPVSADLQGSTNPGPVESCFLGTLLLVKSRRSFCPSLRLDSVSLKPLPSRHCHTSATQLGGQYSLIAEALQTDRVTHGSPARLSAVTRCHWIRPAPPGTESNNLELTIPAARPGGYPAERSLCLTKRLRKLY